MTRLLHIECSPRKDRSASLEVARSFIASYQKAHPDTNVTTLDLWQLTLPEFSGDVLNAKYAGLNGVDLNVEQEKAWTTLRALAAYLHEADLIVLSVPLWNFGIPYKLKHFIDLVSQKDVLFTFDPEKGLQGLLQRQKAVVVYARGLDFSMNSTTPARDYDFQKPYVETWLEFIGITDVHSVIVEKTILGEDTDRASRQHAIQQAEMLVDQLR